MPTIKIKQNGEWIPIADNSNLSQSSILVQDTEPNDTSALWIDTSDDSQTYETITEDKVQEMISTSTSNLVTESRVQEMISTIAIYDGSVT